LALRLRKKEYYVSTVGLDEKVIREYIKNQEDEDKRQDQLGFMAE
jgi:putative transposase